MPITKSKEDTWKSSELREQLKTVRFKETSMSKLATDKSNESRHRSRDDDDVRKKSKRREDVDKYELTPDDRRKDGKHREEHQRRKERETENGKRDGKAERAKEKDRRSDKPDDRLREKEKDKERHRDRDKDKEGRRDKDKEDHRDKDRNKDKERERYKDKERDRERHKDNERDRERHKDNERDRDRHKDKERHRDKEEDQSKDKERNRDKERERDRDRDRDRDRERDKHKEKDRKRDKDRRRDEHRKDDEHNSSRHKSKIDGDDNDADVKDRRHKRRDDKRDIEKINSSKHNNHLENTESKRDDEDNDYDYEDDFEAYEEDFEKHVSGDDDDGDDDSDDSDRHDKQNNKTSIDDKKKRDDNNDDLEEAVPIGQKEGQAVVKGELGVMSDLMKAMAEENEKLLNKSAIFKRSHESDGDRLQRDDKLFPNFLINFSKEKMSKVSGRMRARAEEVLKFVELDQKVFDLFALNPASEYEVFIKRFGNSGYMQTYVQTGDDDVDRELQTEEIITRDASTQQPMQFTLRSDNSDSAKNTQGEFVDFIDSPSLTRFLSNTVPVMLELLEESRTKEFFASSEHKPSNVSFAESLLEFEAPEILKGRPVTSCHFSNNFHNWFLTIHTPPQRTETADDWALRGIICMWNIYELNSPFKILACQSDPTCCCFSPFGSSLVFAGMTDGTLLLWDLTVSAASTAKNMGGVEKLLRQPSFDNALLTSTNHKSSVVSIGTLEPSKICSEGDAKRKDDLDFQVVTLELNSLIYLWVPVEVADQGLDLDLGLSPGGKIKLIQSSVISLASPRKSFGEPSYQSIQLAVLPSNHSQLFVSTNSGRIVHVMKNARKAVPAFYQSALGLHDLSIGMMLISDYITEVTSMDLSQFDPPLILAGYSDGSLRIFKTNSGRPICEWMSSTKGRPIGSVAWVKTRPSCFLVADDNAIYIWDLCFSSDEPASSWSNKSSRLNAIAATQLETSRSSDGSSFAGMMAVFLSDGRCEIHKLKEEFTRWSRNEDEKWKAFLDV